MYDEIRKTIRSVITEFETVNQLKNYWKEPIIEIISAKNPELDMLKKTISIDHLLPYDILPEAKSIISFFIPFQDIIVESNIGGIMASKEWSIAYIKTNELIKTINDKIEKLLKQKGYKTGKIPATHNFDKDKLMSNWSHRHIAYIAGIGTFGINNMLITKNGCCGRFGSIIISYEFDEYRETKIVKEKCLNKINGTCGICQKKCIINAYQNNNFNRHICYEQCLKNDEYHKAKGLSSVCGKCLVGLPCSIKEP
jgi:epoxyqueuosine reductase QueG